MIRVGQKAPDFLLTDTALQQCTLADYAGKPLVILFFPLAFTGTCTKEMCATQEDLSKYAELNASVLGVSVDSPFVLKQFAELYGLQFRLGSDFNRTMTKEYGVSFDGSFLGMTGFSRRAAFVLDKQHIVRYEELVTESGALPNFEAILHQLSLC